MADHQDLVRGDALRQGVAEIGRAGSLTDAVDAAQWAVVMQAPIEGQLVSPEEQDYLALLRSVLSDEPGRPSLRTIRTAATEVLRRHPRAAVTPGSGLE